jgi:phage tail-like protein
MPPGNSLQAPLAQYAVLETRNITDQSAFMGVFKSVSGLEASFEVLEYAEGGNNDFVHHLPGRMTYPRLTLSWGLTVVSTLQDWFFQTHVKADVREITLTLYNRTSSGGAGGKRTLVFADAYPVRWVGPSIRGDAPDSWAAWEESLEIAHSGLRLSS